MLHIIDNYYAKTNNYGYTVTRQKKKQENRGSYMRNTWLCRNAEGSGGTGKERYSAQPHQRKGCGAFRNTCFLREQTERILKAMAGVEV